MKDRDADSAGGGIPAISHVFDDGTLVELLYDRATSTTAFAVSVNSRPMLGLTQF
jgi:hypothetical protein